MKEKVITSTTQAPKPTTINGVWINPHTGREMGATLDDLIRDMKAKQKAK